MLKRAWITYGQKKLKIKILNLDLKGPKEVESPGGIQISSVRALVRSVAHSPWERGKFQSIEIT